MARSTVGTVGMIIVAAMAQGCSGGFGGGGGAGGGGGGGGGIDSSAAVTDTTTMRLMREVFSYRGAGRDPFRSLVAEGPELRPFIEDLRVTSIIYDARYPARSVAVLRDVSEQTRYEVRANQALGRLRVVEVREHDVVFTIEDFGERRQVVLSVRRRGGGDQ